MLKGQCRQILTLFLLALMKGHKNYDHHQKKCVKIFPCSKVMVHCVTRYFLNGDVT